MKYIIVFRNSNGKESIFPGVEANSEKEAIEKYNQGSFSHAHPAIRAKKEGN